MPADMMEKNSSPVAATPASVSATPDKPKTAAEHRKVKAAAPRCGLGRGSLRDWGGGSSRGAHCSLPLQSSKPIMEKRRRARINESLSQLKTLILDALKKDSSRHSKLEKADILEMTVKHLRNLQRAQMTAALSTDPTVLGKYRAGFSECMNEVTRFLSTCEGVNSEVRTRLLGHLASCMTQINAMNYPAQPPPLPPPGAPHASFGQPLAQIPAGAAPPGGSAVPLSGMPCKLGSPAGEATKVYGGFQLVPASDGQFAFLIPNTFAPGGAVVPLYPSSGPGSGGPAGGPGSGGPAGGPSLTADSVWRPW
ncbi:transcription factor HES-1 isoform X1 [Gopherus flavomarginatus]|uniref:transcription factor HES-1 isoform X1 n=1 Tax=Gopherus flavomarginatus TaxID=286002 RepID=UPI0021CBC56A|nr:transcription factor HES-1 isoform X1 [Gopherus flavomarginatus]